MDPTTQLKPVAVGKGYRVGSHGHGGGGGSISGRIVRQRSKISESSLLKPTPMTSTTVIYATASTKTASNSHAQRSTAHIEHSQRRQTTLSTPQQARTPRVEAGFAILLPYVTRFHLSGNVATQPEAGLAIAPGIELDPPSGSTSSWHSLYVGGFCRSPSGNITSRRSGIEVATLPATGGQTRSRNL